MKWLSAVCLAVCVALTGAVLVRAADKKDESKLGGKWSKKVSNFEVVFDFKKDNKLTAVISNDGGDKLTVDATYTLDKEGLLSGTVDKVETAGNVNGPEKGEKFSFKVEQKKDTMTIKDLSSNGGDEAKQLIEGEYKKAK